MLYFEDMFYILCIFVIAYIIFKNDVGNLLNNSGIVEKDFASCYILKYPKHAEFHNKNLVYKIDIDEFFRLNPKLKNRIKVVERQGIDSTKADSLRNEIAERKKIKEEFSEKNFWAERDKIKNRIA